MSSNIPNDLFYTTSHEWVKPEIDGTLSVGITDHAQCLLGDVVFLELPKIGKKVSQGKETAVIESVKAAADVYAPLSGEIIAINEQLKSTPELINQSPYENAWIFKINPAEAEAYKNLLTADQYRSHISE